MDNQRINKLLNDYLKFSITTNADGSTPVTRNDLENFRKKTAKLISGIVAEINSKD